MGSYVVEHDTIHLGDNHRLYYEVWKDKHRVFRIIIRVNKKLDVSGDVIDANMESMIFIGKMFCRGTVVIEEHGIRTNLRRETSFDTVEHGRLEDIYEKLLSMKKAREAR